MTAQPQWEPTDQGDLLALVAQGSLATDTADREWDYFMETLPKAADPDGRIWPNTLRPRLRGHIAPQRIGALTNRALSRGLIVGTGDWEPSDDKQGRNGGKPARVYRWIGSQTATEPDPLGLGG